MRVNGCLKTFRTLEPQQQNNLLILFATGLLFWSSLACLLPTLPLYVKDLGGTTQQVGLVMGAFAVGLLLFRQKLGQLSDVRSRKLVVLIGLAVVAIAPLGYLGVKSVPFLMLIRAFHGISIAAFTTGSSALIVDLSPVEKRGEIIGYMSLTNPLGVAIGPAIGGFLQQQAGYVPLFVFSFIAGLLGFLCALRVREPEPQSRSVEEFAEENAETSLTHAGHSERFWKLLGSPRLRIPTLVMLLAGLIFGSVATFVALYIRDMELALNPGWFFTAAALSSFSVRLVTGRASDRYGRGLFISISLVFYGLSMLLLSQAQSPIYFLLAGCLEGAGAGTLIPSMIALISDRSHANERGRMFALCIGGFDLGIAIAGPVLGTFAQQLSYRGIFSLSLSLAILALILFMTQNGKNLRHSFRFATGRERDIYAIYSKKQSQ